MVVLHEFCARDWRPAFFLWRLHANTLLTDCVIIEDIRYALI